LDNEHIEVVYEMGEVVGFTGEGSDESEWDGTINKSTVVCCTAVGAGLTAPQLEALQALGGRLSKGHTAKMTVLIAVPLNVKGHQKYMFAQERGLPIVTLPRKAADGSDGFDVRECILQVLPRMRNLTHADDTCRFSLSMNLLTPLFGLRAAPFHTALRDCEGARRSSSPPSSVTSAAASACHRHRQARRPPRVCVCECARASRADTSACCAGACGPAVHLSQRLCCLRLSIVALLEVVVLVLVPCWGGQDSSLVLYEF
jgi:hypothetical protein